MKNDTYYIKFLNGRKDIIIPPLDINDETCLTLFGKNTENWGALFNENMLHILENFKRDTQPAYGDYILDGQLWFDTSEDTLRKGFKVRQLKLYTNNKDNYNQWEVICNAESEPLTDIVLKSDLSILDDYIKISNNTKQMTGQLLVKPLTNDSPDSSYATKKYVENKICKCAYDKVSMEDSLVSSLGDTLTHTKVMVPNDYSDSSYAAFKQYVDDEKYFNIVYDKDIAFSNGAVYDLNDMNCYIITSGKDVMRFMTGKFRMLKDIDMVEISWSKPFINDFYTMVSGEMHEYSPYDTNSGIPDDIYATIIPKEFSKIKINRTTKNIDEIVHFMIHGNLINDNPELPPACINKAVSWSYASMEVTITLPEGFTFKSDAKGMVKSSDAQITGVSTIVPPNIMKVKLDAGSSANKSIPVSLEINSTMFDPADTLQDMVFNGTITRS